METGRSGRTSVGGSALRQNAGEAGPSTAQARAKKKSKAKTGSGNIVSRKNTIPKPFLALAPAPATTLAGSRFHEALSHASLSNLVLPSSFPRGTGISPNPNVPMAMTTAGPSRHAPTGRTRKFATGLLAPPAVMPGGVAASPRVQPAIAGRTGRSTPVALNDTPEGMIRKARSGNRLREISGSGANASMMSLGHTGRLLQSDPVVPPLPSLPVQLRDAGPVPQQVSSARRRRVVRGEEEARRRLTVSTREEGRAMGIARGASMRRLNVWDNLPESSDPPPAFPFPTAATNRLPPTFESAQNTVRNPTSATRPRSPPPTFDQALGLAPLPNSSNAVRETEEVARQQTLAARIEPPLQTPPDALDFRPSSPESDYVSARDSPTGSFLALPDADEERARSDRQLWNLDLLAGYSLEERVRREMGRRKSREEDRSTPVGSLTTLPNETSATSIPGDASLVNSAVIPPPKEANDAVGSARPKPVVDTSSAAMQHQTPISSPVRESPLTASTPRGSIRTLTKQPSGPLASPTTRTPKAENITPGRELAMASVVANPPTASRTAVSPRSPLSGIKTRNFSSVDLTTSNPDAIVDVSPPSRKLSRGAAVRRTSSGLRSETGSNQNRQSPVSPKQPLFSSPGRTASQILDSPESNRTRSEQRFLREEDSIVPSREKTIMKHRTKSQPNLLLQSISENVPTEALPPHREAALKRRDLHLPRLALDTTSNEVPRSPTKSGNTVAQSSGPLINFNRINSQASPSDVGDHSAWTAELLQLLDQVSSPIAESSSQERPNSQGLPVSASASTATLPVISSISAGKKRPPPPPPPIPLRVKRQQQLADTPASVSRKRSVLSTANSPIIPFTTKSSALSSAASQRSPSEGKPPERLPTRRPAPLPPKRPADDPEASEAPLPVGPPTRPSPQQAVTFSTSTSSADAVVPESSPPQARRPYTALSSRPRGPRPPPAPMRQWSKVVSQTWEQPAPLSPANPSSPTEFSVDTSIVNRSHPLRSTSAQDLRSPLQRTETGNQMEYTDLDVFVSRLEGSGREYEVSRTGDDTR
ncbi:hypothetical protein BD324DRAFT_46918 [Kockovaella imperatae]|uniref:Uncharacterized protein n=1 Tax=Kockovaella imperatae TaxID=4999 RepID=A0A1Y1UUD3_9TREE|nr:hypothetical protein BD324DRAFT_46918 [Kockovaella imperatae]ORX41174.1 hypothetical protein BD324DRAFT_46918 [Kockovaella imperatae]